MTEDIGDVSGLRIRRIRVDDFARVLDYFDALSDQSKALFHPHPFDRANARRIVEGAVDPDCFRIGAVVGEGAAERIVGYAYFQGAAERDFPSVGIGVADEFHGRGVGKDLMQALVEQARALGKKGLELDVYKENWGGLHVYSQTGFRICGQTDDHKQHSMRLEFADEDSPFPLRAMYLHPIPWNLTRLTADTWTFDEWKWYLELLQSAGCNMLKIYIWGNQFYHPNQPRTFNNAWRYDVYKRVLQYAHVLGMRTYVAFSNNTTPAHEWLAHPELRAQEVGYQGTALCWTRGKDAIVPYQNYVIDTFADCVDGFILWFADPGLCICESCRDQKRVFLDSIQTFEQHLADRARLHLCLWWLEDIAKGVRGIPSNPGLREALLDRIAPEDFVILDERTPETLQMGVDRGLKILRFAFFLDPEGGDERHNILPEPKLAEIEDCIAQARGSNDAGVIAYRLTPYVQFASDWVFFQAMLRPERSTEEALSLLRARLGIPEELDGTFVGAIRGLDAWWRERKPATLRGALREMEALRAHAPREWNHVADAGRVLSALAEHLERGDGKELESLVVSIQDMMNTMTIFQAFTLDNLWVGSRARAFVRQRVQWWLERLGS